MLRKLFDFMTIPIKWFWDRYRTFKEKKQWGKAVFVLILSLIGMSFILFAVTLISIKLVEWIIDLVSRKPIVLVVVGGVIWLYILVKHKSDDGEVASSKDPITEKTEAELRDQAIQGYPAMLNVMYQTIRAEVDNLGGSTPTFPAEVEMPQERYVIKNGVIFYQFKLNKKDVKSICDDTMLNEYCNMLQYKVRTKLHNGEFPSIQISDFRDQYGNGLDGIVVDHLNDYGGYFVIYAVYASSAYSEYRHVLMQSNASMTNSSAGISEGWNS